jgi:hypothetical protein
METAMGASGARNGGILFPPERIRVSSQERPYCAYDLAEATDNSIGGATPAFKERVDMTCQSWSRLLLHVLIFWVLAGNAVWAQQEENRGFVFYESFQGSTNAIGMVNRLDTTVGYRFNRFVELNVGLPLYFIRPSDSISTTFGTNSHSGLGNVYSNLRLTLANPTIRYTSILTATAPTGDKVKGFSTGRGSVDWTNTFSHDFYWALPYVSAGIANTVSDTSFFVRPFSSIGFVGHVEAGSTFRVNRFSSVGISGYKVMPSGEQTVISRLVPRETIVPVTTSTTPAPPGRGNGRGLGLGRTKGSTGVTTTTVQTFEVVTETFVEADFAKDHGVSAWWSINPSPSVTFYVGFSRSFPFDLNTVFFGTSFDVGSLIRKARRN